MNCAPNIINYQEMNVDWVIKTVLEVYQKTENDFQVMLNEYMEKYFTNVLVHATYDPETETINLVENKTEV